MGKSHLKHRGRGRLAPGHLLELLLVEPAVLCLALGRPPCAPTHQSIMPSPGTPVVPATTAHGEEGNQDEWGSVRKG